MKVVLQNLTKTFPAPGRRSRGEVVAVNVLRPVFRYILAAGGALVLACFLSWGLNLRLDRMGALGAAEYARQKGLSKGV